MASPDPKRYVKIQIVTGGPGHCSDRCPFIEVLPRRDRYCNLFQIPLTLNQRRKRNRTFRCEGCQLADVGGDTIKRNPTTGR